MTQSRHDSRRQQVVRIAFELQAGHEQGEERKIFDDALQDAAVETGLDPRFLAKAEEELARREVLAAEKKARRSKRLRMASVALLGALVLVGSGLGLARVLFPPSPQAWLETFDSPGRWGLDKNPSSGATLAWQPEAGRGQVAVVRVERLAPSQDGKYHVNLDSALAPPDASRYSDFVVDLKGSLPTARVFLEAGPEERWRSPPIDVQQNWTSHRLPLRSFERQEYRGGQWHTVGWSAPASARQISVKVGHFMNSPGTTGELFLDDLRFESP